MARRPKPKTARPVQGNRGVSAAYRKRLMKLVDDMAAGVERGLRSEYRRTPSPLAQDAAPRALIEACRAMADRWVGRFEAWAPKIAESYVRDMFKHSDSAFRRALKDAGWTVNPELTKSMRDAMDAAIAENVGLIKSIPEQYLQQVEGEVLRAYNNGRDLETLVKTLRERYDASASRAALIARDQTNKINEVATRARALDLGVTRAIWMHSHAGKVPRQSHVAADGKEYDLAQGCYIDGEYIHPGELINCRCSRRIVLPTGVPK